MLTLLNLVPFYFTEGVELSDTDIINNRPTMNVEKLRIQKSFDQMFSCTPGNEKTWKQQIVGKYVFLVA